jgi:hypothetical protein
VGTIGDSNEDHKLEVLAMKPKTVAILLIVCSFLLGVVGGVFIQRNFFDSHRGPDSSRRERGRGPMLEYLTKELSLTEVQQKAIEVILEQSRPRFDEIHQSVRSRFQAEIDTVQEQIKAVLIGEQKQHYEETIKKLDQQNKERRRR